MCLNELSFDRFDLKFELDFFEHKSMPGLKLISSLSSLNDLELFKQTSQAQLVWLVQPKKFKILDELNQA